MPDIPFVGIDDRSAATEVARAVLREKPDRIGLIHGPQRSATSRVRLEGFLSAFAAGGRPMQPADMVEAELSMEIRI